MNSRFVFSLLFCFIAISSCKKRNDNVYLANEGTIGFDGYSYADTFFKLLTCTIREDSIKTDSLSHNLVGVINDAVFGKYEAASFFQFKLPQLNNVISNLQLDSAVLIMQYTSPTAYYGDLNSNMAFDIVEVNEMMSSSVSHSTQNYNYDVTPIGSFSGKFRPSDSIYIRELGKMVRIAPSISIKLSTAFATKLFNAGSSDLSTQENFVQYFKGLGMVPTANPSFGSGVIAAFNMYGVFSKIRIYYDDTMQSDFLVHNDSRRFTQYKVSNQSPEITKQKSASSSSLANFDTTYAQAMTGAKTRIMIPNLFGLIDKKTNKKISIGKAEIIIRPMAGTFASPFTVPTRMLILQPDAITNRNAGIFDLFEPFYGGDYNASKNEYRFNITRHIQSLFTDYQLRGKDNNRGLFLTIPTDFPIAPSRIMVDMRKGIPNTGIEFKLTYIEL